MGVTTDWIIGFILGIVSKATNATAVQSYARAHKNISLRNTQTQNKAETEPELGVSEFDLIPKAADPDEPKGSYLCNTCWLIGLSCTIISGACELLALGYAPASLLAPMESLTLIFNMCLNPVINGESVSRYVVIATLVICSGTVITVIFSPRGNPNEGHDIGVELESIYISWYFAVFSVAIGFILCSLWFTTVRWKDKPTVYSLAVPGISGSLAGVNRAIGKGMPIGLKLTFRGDGCFCVEWIWYVILVGIVLSLVGHLKWLNRGLAEFSPIHVIPISSTCAILVTTTAGLVVFREADQFDVVLSKIMFSVGILVIIGGVIGLSRIPKSAVGDKAVEYLSQEDAWAVIVETVSKSMTTSWRSFFHFGSQISESRRQSKNEFVHNQSETIANWRQSILSRSYSVKPIELQERKSKLRRLSDALGIGAKNGSAVNVDESDQESGTLDSKGSNQEAIL